MTELIPPNPTVEHLTTIFRRISKGDIRIPAFQRRLVWDESQVISLLESVYKGFPIGSVLLWSVRSAVLRDANFEYPLFPAREPSFPTNYILDGMQRLSSLYGVFNYEDGESDPRLNIWFNLDSGSFQHRGTVDDIEFPYCVPVRALINPRELFDVQGRFLAEQKNGGDLVDRLIELQSRFQDYMIPLVTITREDVASVVEIFERINNSGTVLDTVDFMRAVTWSNDFDLNGRLDEINATLEEANFDLDEQTLIKIIGLELDKEPLPDALLTMRGETADALNAATGRVTDGVLRVAAFLRERMRVMGAEFVPYEGQILVLYKALRHADQVDLDALVKWYWAVGFNEALRGKPDHYVARAVRSIPDLLAGKVRGVEPRLGLRPVDLVERRFIQGRALSVAVFGLFAHNDPRSLTGGDYIEPESFIFDSSPQTLQPILEIHELERALEQRMASSKILANLFLPSFVERFFLAEKTRIFDYIRDSPPDDEVLLSQFMNREAVDHLREGRFRQFLEVRAALMMQGAARLVGQ